MESKLKHLEFIQEAISRMANNAFLLRGWSASILAGLSALSATSFTRAHLYFATFIILCFWLLDSYYLSRERNFRKLFDEVRVKNPSEINFSMNFNHHKRKRDWFTAGFSITSVLFYGGLFIAELLFFKHI